jgi:leucyl-tRNA synthetase
MIRLEGRKMSKHLGNVVDPNELVAHVGADTVRLAVLHAASPGRTFNWNDQPVRYCQIFLKKLYGYAEGRLREWSPQIEGRARIDTSEKLRRRLANWCAVACEKVAENLERLETQRAAHNAMLLLTRIQDFEQRALERRGGTLEQADREAIVAALEMLTQMLAPLTPHIAEELWSLAGNTTLVSNAPWPAQERPAGDRPAASQAAERGPARAKRDPTSAKRDPAPPAATERDAAPAERALTGGGNA